MYETTYSIHHHSAAVRGGTKLLSMPSSETQIVIQKIGILLAATFFIGGIFVGVGMYLKHQMESMGKRDLPTTSDNTTFDESDIYNQ